MKTIKHKFRNYRNKNDIKILILGTFTPDVENNDAEIFYGRKRNHLWNLLPMVYNQPGMKDAPIEQKLEFIAKYHIGFIDLIEELEVDVGQENNYSDDYIDDRVTKWTDIEQLLNDYPRIKNVYFTRKSFGKIPNMKIRIEKIKAICAMRNIRFNCLPTPARFSNKDKIEEWKIIFKQ